MLLLEMAGVGIVLVVDRLLAAFMYITLLYAERKTVGAPTFLGAPAVLKFVWETLFPIFLATAISCISLIGHPFTRS